MSKRANFGHVTSDGPKFNPRFGMSTIRGEEIALASCGRHKAFPSVSVYRCGLLLNKGHVANNSKKKDAIFWRGGYLSLENLVERGWDQLKDYGKLESDWAWRWAWFVAFIAESLFNWGGVFELELENYGLPRGKITQKSNFDSMGGCLLFEIW